MRGLIQSYHLLATLGFVAASALVAGRLLWLARRTRQRPELLLGLGIGGTAVLGYGVLIAAAILRGGTGTEATTGLERVLHAAGAILHDAGVSMVVLFVLTVFRPRERWARGLATAMGLALWGGHVGWELSNGYRSTLPGNAFWWLRYAVIWSYPLWTMVESYRYYGILRRRLALGLADPLVTNRFLLWGTASLGTALATWTASLPYFLVGDAAAVLRWSPPIQVATATIGVATVTLYGFTFFAPAWYRRRIAGAAPAPLTADRAES
jgi:hypothetical protein